LNSPEKTVLIDDEISLLSAFGSLREASVKFLRFSSSWQLHQNHIISQGFNCSQNLPEDSFQARIRESVAVEKMAGKASGIKISPISSARPAPSIRAASRIGAGMSRKNTKSIQMTSGRFKSMRIAISPTLVSSRAVPGVLSDEPSKVSVCQ
jgi:hypothetical protein